MLLGPHFNFVLVPHFVAERGQRVLRYFRRVVRERPKTAIVVLALLVVVLALLVLVGTGVGLYVYALHQWRAAELAVKEERPAEARSRLKVCLFVWPRSVPVHLLAARAARLSSDFPEAEAHLNQCLKLQNGATEETQLEFLLLRAQTGEEDEVARALFAYAENGHPEAPLIMETMARAYMKNLRLGHAYACLSLWIDYYKNAGEATPRVAKPYFWRGWVQERVDNSMDGMEDYQRALELDPDLYGARLRVAEILLEVFKPLEALPHLQWLSSQHPDDPYVMARLGHCLFLQGEGEEARRLLEAAVQELPDDLPLLATLAKLEMQDRRPDKAEAWLRHALEVDPSDTEALYTLHVALQYQERHKEAAAVLAVHKKKTDLFKRVNQLLRDEAKRPSNDPNVLSELGAILLRVEREKIGLYWLDQALLLDPAHQPTHKVLAEYYQNKGEREKAEVHLSRLNAGKNPGPRAFNPGP